MHRTRKTIIQRLKSVIRAICAAATAFIPRNHTRKQDTHRIPTPISPTSLYFPVPVPILHAADTDTGFQHALRGTEVYLPGPVWDALNPTERFASVADLCAHIGDQLPVQVVKLIARDVLRALGNMHRTHGAGHQSITPTTILLSPTDLRALIAQLRTETQTSLRPSELAIGPVAASHHAHDGAPMSAEASAVFTLADPDCRDRMEYIEDQTLKPPEALLGAPLSTSADIWTLGCIIYELLTGEPLFDPGFQTLERGISSEESHLIRMIELFGTIPVDLITSGTRSSRWFTEDGALRFQTGYYIITLDCLLERHLEGSDVPGATDFLESLLRIQPEKRARPEAAMNHYWFTQ